MRIFLAGTSFDLAYGGPAFSVAGLAKALAIAGGEIGIWAPDGSAVTSSAIARQHGVHPLAGTLDSAIAAFGRPDVIHDNGLWLRHNHALARTARRLGIPRIVSTRGMLEPWALDHKRWKKRLAWLAYQRADLRSSARHHATSREEANNLARLGLRVPIAVIPNGVEIPDQSVLDAARAQGEAGREKAALFLGRLYPVKGLPMLIEAWAQVRPEGWALRIAGPDEAGHRAELEGLISSHGLERTITFLGAVVSGQRTEVYAKADLFILTSHSESFGMAIGEALAHGLPIVTTTGAPWPMLANEKCGWRVTPTVAAIADALRIATAQDDETLKQMGARGRSFVAREFGWSAVGNAMIGLYRSAIADAASETTHATGVLRNVAF